MQYGWGGQQQASAQWGQPQAAQAWGQSQPAMQQGYGQQAAAGGANAWAQPAQQAAPAAGGNNKDVTLVVTGCTHGTVGGIVRGSYQLHGENHGKPAYKKDGQVNGLDVMTYYWDERDGPGFCGWWFGPKVGGDQVWAYHTDKSAAMPPQNGWKVPYDGPVDPTFAIAYKPKAAAGGMQMQQQQQQQPMQQQAWGQQQQQQQGWGQQQAAQQQQAQQQQQQAMQQMQQQKMQEQAGLENQRRQLEELKKKQQMENTKRAEEMRQSQMLMQQQKLAENKQRLQMANEQRINDQKRKMEEMKAQQQQLLEKRKAESLAKEAEMAAKKLEQQAVLNVRRIMQKFRASTPETFDANVKELTEAMQKDADTLGSQKEKLSGEVEAAVAQTKQRIDAAREVKKKAEEQREGEINRRKELRVKAEALVAELEGLVVKAETSAKSVVEEADPFTGDKEMKLNEIQASASAVDEAGKEANDLCQTCSNFVLKESAQIKNTPPVQGENAATCAMDLTKLVARINEAKKITQNTMSKVTVSKGLRIKKAEAKDKYDKSLAQFKKYDSDKDGKLSRREIQAFAKGAYAFNVPVDTLDSICSRLIKEDSKGVEKADYHKMRVMVGVAREAAMDAKRKKTREDRDKQLEKLKEKLTENIEKAAELIKEASEAVGKAEKAVAPLNAGKAATTAVEMVALADETDGVIEESKKSLATAKDAVTKLSAESEPELKSFILAETRKLQNTLNPIEQRSAKSSGISSRFRADATKKNATELEKLRVDGLAMIFHHQGAKKLMSLGLLEAFDKKKKGKVEESAFVRFFKTCEMKEEDDERMSEANASRLFSYLDAEDVGHLSKDQFMNFIRKFMKVAKASVMTDDISTKSKPLRRLNEGEVLECLTGPTLAEGDEITRVKVKAMSDDVEGWVTPVGNRGTVFIEDGGNVFKVVKETIMTGAFVIGGGDGKVKDRKLKVGEQMEVREWARKEEASGMMRMKARMKSDGHIGWVTTMGNTGIPFVEVV